MKKFPLEYSGLESADCLCALQRWDVISKSQMKNIRKLWHREQMKSESREKKEVSSACCGRLSV